MHLIGSQVPGKTQLAHVQDDIQGDNRVLGERGEAAQAAATRIATSRASGYVFRSVSQVLGRGYCPDV